MLVNGLPLVHIELKRRGVAIREAFYQIDRYKKDSFCAGSGLYEYIQIFVISNGTNTKYYSNSTKRNAEKGAVRSTATLKRQLDAADAKIIITTIQKLATFVKTDPSHEVYAKHVVIIFDEYHRSQFGDMHTTIVKNFKKYHLFGFTGTPIFRVNSSRAKKTQFFITKTLGNQLHSYTIDDVVFEIELIRQIEINIDYILMLVKKYHDSHFEDKEVLITIDKSTNASSELRSQKQLIERFIARVNDVDDVVNE